MASMIYQPIIALIQEASSDGQSWPDFSSQDLDYKDLYHIYRDYATTSIFQRVLFET